MQELRLQRDVKQVDAARKLGTTQSLLSRLERRRNPRVGTLRNFVAALGGELVLIARFPGEDIVLKPVGGKP